MFGRPSSPLFGNGRRRITIAEEANVYEVLGPIDRNVRTFHSSVINRTNYFPAAGRCRNNSGTEDDDSEDEFDDDDDEYHFYDGDDEDEDEFDDIDDDDDFY